MHSTDTAPALLTGDVARLLDVSPETVRFWERTGSLTATKTQRGTRIFKYQDVMRLAAEREARSAARPAPGAAV